MSRRALQRTVTAACVSLVAAAPVWAQETIGDLAQHPVRVHKDTREDRANAQRAMQQYRRFLDIQRADPRMRAEALRRLGDLDLDAGDLDRMETEVNAVDMQGAEAIKLYTTLLKAYPHYPRNDQVLYQLARAYWTTGQPEQALATLDRIVKQYPDTRRMDEIQFRRGELLFSAKRYHDAELAYAEVLKRGSSSEFYEQSLYKHGWSLFKESETVACLPSFEAVLDHYLVGRRGQVILPDQLRRADRELVDDTLRVMSISFSYADGAATLDQFLKQNDRPYAYLLYSRLGDLYVSKQRYQDAAAAYRAFVAHDPYSDEAPNLSMQAIEAYEKGGLTQLVLEGKHEFLERYNFGSPFWANRRRADYPKVVQELKTNLRDVATYFHAQAQKTHSFQDYQEAVRWYRNYLKSFPSDPDTPATSYLLADALFESGQYAEAAAQYEQTAYGYPGNARAAQAAYAALDAYKKAEEGLTGAAKSQMHDRAIDSGVRFAQSFPTAPDSAGVLTRAAEDVFAARDVPRAMQIADIILSRKPPVDIDKQRIAYTILAESHEELGDEDLAERAFIRARELAVNDPASRADLTERLAATVYKEAETKKEAGDIAGAVADYLRVGTVAPDSKIRATAEYDAAAALITVKDWTRAIQVLQDFQRQFPNNALSGEVSRKLAVAYSAASHPGEAAAQFERVAFAKSEDPKVQRAALLQAADLYAQANNLPKATAMLEKYLSANPTPVGPAEEAREKLAEYASKSGDTARRDYWYRQIVLADTRAGAQSTQRTHYLAAKAQLALAAPARDAFRAIRLTLPLKRTLAAKRRALQRAMKAYQLAASYQVAEVTTAATYEIAELYRQLANDIMGSERPRGLSGEALEEYNTLLEDQVYPFEEEAIKAHQVNAERARDGVYDEWVQKSFAALAELDPARYGKTELTQDVLTRLE